MISIKANEDSVVIHIDGNGHNIAGELMAIPQAIIESILNDSPLSKSHCRLLITAYLAGTIEAMDHAREKLNLGVDDECISDDEMHEIFPAQ